MLIFILFYGKNIKKKKPKLPAIYDLALQSFKSDKIAPQTTKKLHFGHSISCCRQSG